MHYHSILTLVAAGVLATSACAQTAVPAPQGNSDKVVPVTVENFIRAESDRYFGAAIKDGGFGKFEKNREALPIDNQRVVRTNRDTLYASAIIDLDAGPVTVTLPDAGKRFMSMQVINEDEFTPKVVYGAGSYTFTKREIGTRYAFLTVRILVDLNSPADLAKVHALQDAITLTQPGGPGRFEAPNWDPVSQAKVRDALLVLASTLPDTDRSFGTQAEVDPVRRLLGAASAWGGNPDRDALYLNVVPKNNDGKIPYRLTVKNVPVDGFWSISVYNARGYFQKNALNAYALNDVTAKRSADGSITVQFGGCDGKITNCLPIEPGWNYMVRLYRPRAEVLEGQWQFPRAQPIHP